MYHINLCLTNKMYHLYIMNCIEEPPFLCILLEICMPKSPLRVKYGAELFCRMGIQRVLTLSFLHVIPGKWLKSGKWFKPKMFTNYLPWVQPPLGIQWSTAGMTFTVLVGDSESNTSYASTIPLLGGKQSPPGILY